MIGVIVPSTQDKEVQDSTNKDEDCANDEGEEAPGELSSVVQGVVLIVLASCIDADDTGDYKRNSCNNKRCRFCTIDTCNQNVC